MNWTKFFRVHHWWYFTGFTLLGSVYAQTSPASTFLSVILSALLLCFGFAFNGATDDGEHVKESFTPLLLSLPMLLLASPSQLVAYAAVFVMLVLYSHPKSDFQAVPLLGTLLNPLVFSSLFLFGWVGGKPLDDVGVLLFTLLFFLEIVSQFLHEAADYEEDKRIGKKTTIVKYGKKWVKPLSTIALIVSVLVSKPLGPWFFWPTTLVAIIFSGLLSSVKDYSLLREYYKNTGILVGLLWVSRILI